MFKYLTDRGVALISFILIASGITAGKYGHDYIAGILLLLGVILMIKLEKS